MRRRLTGTPSRDMHGVQSPAAGCDGFGSALTSGRKRCVEAGHQHVWQHRRARVATTAGMVYDVVNIDRRFPCMCRPYRPALPLLFTLRRIFLYGNIRHSLNATDPETDGCCCNPATGWLAERKSGQNRISAYIRVEKQRDRFNACPPVGRGPPTRSPAGVRRYKAGSDCSFHQCTKASGIDQLFSKATVRSWFP